MQVQPFQSNNSNTSTIIFLLEAEDISEESLGLWRKTFQNYLATSVQNDLGLGLNFSVFQISKISLFQLVESGSVHFVFASQSIFSCLELEGAGNRSVPTFKNRIEMFQPDHEK